MVDERTREALRQWTLATPSVSAFVASLVRDFQDRDDVLQETAVAVLESIDRYDPAQPFVAWAIGIARNQVRLNARRRARAALFSEAAEESLAHAFVATADDDPRLDWLADCVASLPPTDGELCRLRYADDLKPAAIARAWEWRRTPCPKRCSGFATDSGACVERKAILAGGTR